MLPSTATSAGDPWGSNAAVAGAFRNRSTTHLKEIHSIVTTIGSAETASASGSFGLSGRSKSEDCRSK